MALDAKQLMFYSGSEEHYRKQGEILESIELRFIRFASNEAVENVLKLCSMAVTYGIDTKGLKTFDRQCNEYEKMSMLFCFNEIKGKIRDKINENINNIAQMKYDAMKQSSFQTPDIFKVKDMEGEE